MSARTRLVGLLLFGSGFCALVYQTTWLREFQLIFGGSTAASAVVEHDDIPRRTVGLLYGANGLGAVVGAASGTFYFFENFGNRATLWMAAILNVVVALGAFSISKSTSASKPRSELPRESDKGESDAQTNPLFVF